jgi:heat shock protein HtpX
MGRLWLRSLMAGVGIAILAVCTAGAIGGALLLGVVLADPPGLVPLAGAFLASVVILGYAGYRMGTTQLVARLDARELPPERAPELYRRLARLCGRMDVSQPPILVADLGAPNALSIGGPKRGVVVLDRDLFGMLTIDEFEGLLAHELAHMESYDTFVHTLIVTAVRTFVALVMLLLFPIVLFLFGVDRAAAWIAGTPRQRQFGLMGLFQWAVSLVLGLVLGLLTLGVLAYSRRREFAADSRAATVTGKPGALARALVKIHEASRPRGGLLSLLYVQHDSQEQSRLLSTHPPLSDRVERLVGRTDHPVGRHHIDRLRR